MSWKTSYQYLFQYQRLTRTGARRLGQCTHGYKSHYGKLCACTGEFSGRACYPERNSYIDNMSHKDYRVLLSYSISIKVLKPLFLRVWTKAVAQT